MKFVVLKSFMLPGYLAKERVILGHKGEKQVLTLGYLHKKTTFNENSMSILVLNENTDSIQTRPRAIYKSEGKYYVKEHGKKTYLTRIDEIQLKAFIEWVKTADIEGYTISCKELGWIK